MKPNLNLEIINKEFDDLKMQGQYEDIIKLVTKNKTFLEKNKWNVDKIIKDCITIAKLHKGL